MAENSLAVLAELSTMSRDPFRVALSRLMSIPPTDEALSEWAARNPLAWSQAISILAGLAGYRTEESRRTVTVHAHGGASVSIGVGADGRIIDADAYRSALIRELGPDVAAQMLARLPQLSQTRQPVTLEAESPPDPAE